MKKTWSLAACKHWCWRFNLFIKLNKLRWRCSGKLISFKTDIKDEDLMFWTCFPMSKMDIVNFDEIPNSIESYSVYLKMSIKQCHSSTHSKQVSNRGDNPWKSDCEACQIQDCFPTNISLPTKTTPCHKSCTAIFQTSAIWYLPSIYFRDEN